MHVVFFHRITIGKSRFVPVVMGLEGNGSEALNCVALDKQRKVN